MTRDMSYGLDSRVRMNSGTISVSSHEGRYSRRDDYTVGWLTGRPVDGQVDWLMDELSIDDCVSRCW